MEPQRSERRKERSHSLVHPAVAPHSPHPLKELTDRNVAVDKWRDQEEGERQLEATENAKSTGQRRGWKNKEHTKVGLTVWILYNDNQSN